MCQTPKSILDNLISILSEKNPARDPRHCDLLPDSNVLSLTPKRRIVKSKSKSKLPIDDYDSVYCVPIIGKHFKLIEEVVICCDGEDLVVCLGMSVWEQIKNMRGEIAYLVHDSYEDQDDDEQKPAVHLIYVYKVMK